MPLRNFYELYKYGSVRLERESCVAFEKYDANGYPEVDHTQFVEKIPFFDSDDQGIILEGAIDKNTFESVNFDISGIIQGSSIKLKGLTVVPVPLLLHIGDVIKIYPLSENALRSLPGKIGDNIALEKPVFQNLFEQAVVGWEEIIRSQGAQALFEMSGLDMPQDRKLLDSFLDQAEKYKLTNQKPDKEGRFLLHALVYERREPFPKSDIGILFDLCKILADKSEMPNYRKTNFFDKLDKIKSKFDHTGILGVLQYFESEPHYEKVRKMTTHAECQHKDYITAALFTKYKELLRDDKYKSVEMINEIQKLFNIFPEETKTALYLIGAFFSYKRFYNDLYISKRLKILKESRVTTESSTTPEEVPLGPQGVSTIEVVVPAESKISTLKNGEKPLDEAKSGKETEPLPFQGVSNEKPSVIPIQDDDNRESIQPLQPIIEKTDQKQPLDNLSDSLLFEGKPTIAQDKGMSKKEKGRKPKISKKLGDEAKK